MTAPTTIPISPARRSGPLIFLSGQLALRDGKIVGDDVATQTSLAIDAIAHQLSTFGLGLADVIKTSAWLVSQGDFAAFNEIYATRFVPPYPARSTVISRLAIPEALVEIEAIAELRGPF